jgi:hypothetical protein
MSLADLMYFAMRCRTMAERENDPRMRLALMHMAVDYDNRASLIPSVMLR